MLKRLVIVSFATLLALPALAIKSQCDRMLTRRIVEIKSLFPQFPWRINDSPELIDAELGPHTELTDTLDISFKNKTYRIPAKHRLDVILAEHASVIPYVAVESQLLDENGPRLSVSLVRDDVQFAGLSKNPDTFIDRLYNDIYKISVVDSREGGGSGRFELDLKIHEARHKLTLASEGDSLLFLVGRAHRKLTNLKKQSGSEDYSVEVGYGLEYLPKTALGPVFYLRAADISGLFWRANPTTQEKELQVFGTTASGEPVELISRGYLEGLKTLESLLNKSDVRMLIGMTYNQSGRSSRHTFTFIN